MKLQNRTFDELHPGDSAELHRLITHDDLYVYAASSGNYNLLHIPGEDGTGDGEADEIAPGMFLGSLVSAVLGTLLPGPGTLSLSHAMEFVGLARAGDEVLSRVTVTARHDDGSVSLDTEVTRPRDGARIMSGKARVMAPRLKITAEDFEVPGLIVQHHRHFAAILDRARPLAPLRTAVVVPEEANALGGALLAARETIITPILIGDPDRIAAVAQASGADLSGIEILEASSHGEAARLACDLVHQGRAQAVMKGALHTDDLLRPMLDKDRGLRIGRRFTHVFVMDVPGMPHPIMVTDAAINIAPDLMTKVDIVQNAIDLWLSISADRPRVGVLSAVETVNPAIQSSIDAALLSKMADRGQITGGLVEGPLAMDNAVDLRAAHGKGLHGAVAGRANILVVPGIDAGNMLAKQLSFVSRAEAAGLVLGARVPVILNSRSDSSMSRLASCAVAALHHARMEGGKA